MNVRKLAFRIRKPYFELIQVGTKTTEYRRDIEFWHKRIKTLFPNLPCDISDLSWFFNIYGNFTIVAVFICGKRKHSRYVRGIERIWTPTMLSEQGQRDVDTPTCLAFHLGEEY